MRRERGRNIHAFDRVRRLPRQQRVRRADIGVLGDHVTRRRHHRHFIGAWHQPGEADIAVGVGHRRLPGRVARTVQQVDRHARQRGLAIVLRTIGVGIGIDMRRERGRNIQPGRSHHIRLACHHCDTAVQATIRRADHIAGRCDDEGLVSPRLQPGEAVIAVRIRGRGREDRRAGSVQQLNGHAGDAILPALLRAIAVGIEPDAAADRSRRRTLRLGKTLRDLADADEAGSCGTGGHRLGEGHRYIQVLIACRQRDRRRSGGMRPVQ